MNGWTREQPAPGVVVWQPARGFRYGAEAFWVAGLGEGRVALDLGTGSGIMALLLAARGLEVVGVDLRPEWEAGWEASLAESRLAGTARLMQADVATWEPERRFDLVVSNPPFFAAGTGPVAPDPWRAAARSESSADLRRFCAVAELALRPEGRLVMVVPVEREKELRRVITLPARRWWRVGRRRVIVEAWAGPAGDEVCLVEEGGEVAAGWYRRARGA